MYWETVRANTAGGSLRTRTSERSLASAAAAVALASFEAPSSMPPSPGPGAVDASRSSWSIPRQHGHGGASFDADAAARYASTSPEGTPRNRKMQQAHAPIAVHAASTIARISSDPSLMIPTDSPQRYRSVAGRYRASPRVPRYGRSRRRHFTKTELSVLSLCADLRQGLDLKSSDSRTHKRRRGGCIHRRRTRERRFP